MTTVSYPKVPAKAWGILRARATAAPSTKFTPTVVAALLELSSPKSAGDNIVYPMRKLGLFDEDGALTERGNRWRNDASYAEACQEILDEIYPSELTGLTDSQGAPDTPKVNAWMQHKGLGGSNAKQMAVTYTMIAQKSVPAMAPTSQTKKNSQNGTRKAPPKVTAKPEVNQEIATPPAQAPESVRQPTSGPNIHLDIQVHIPVNATAEQIDQIFASMAKHLYPK